MISRISDQIIISSLFSEMSPVFGHPKTNVIRFSSAPYRARIVFEWEHKPGLYTQGYTEGLGEVIRVVSTN
jgi:hypothetical protein